MPLVKEERIVVTFHNTTEAMHMEKCAKAEGISGRLIPVPRQITAGCGLAWSAPLQEERKLRTWIEKEKLTIQNICQLQI